MASPTAQQVKNPLAMQETQETPVQFLGWEDPRRRYWQPTLVFLPEKSHGQRILAGCSPMSHRVGYDWMIKHKHSAWLTLHWLPVFHYELKSLIVIKNRGLTGGAVVKNSANEWDTGSIPGPRKITHAKGQLSPRVWAADHWACAASTKFTCCNYGSPHAQRPCPTREASTRWSPGSLQLEKSQSSSEDPSQPKINKQTSKIVQK